jgi:hypothetical protein
MLILSFLFAPVQSVFAQTFSAPREISYQAKLATSGNVAVPDGLYHVTFRLYTVPTGGAALWTEVRTGANRVTVTNGLFSVMLGSVTSLAGVDFNQPLYLGVEIGGSAGAAVWDGEMTPRKSLGAVPSALVADTLDGLDSAAFLRATATTSTGCWMRRQVPARKSGALTPSLGARGPSPRPSGP